MLKIRPEDRLCVAGLPGTGKTTLMREYLTYIPDNIYIIDHLSQYKSFGEAGDVLQGKTRYDPGIEMAKGIPPGDPRAKLEEIAKKLHHVSNTTLIIEEAELYLPQGRAVPPWTQSLIQAGRNWGIGIYLNTRRIQRLDKAFFDLCQEVFFFRCGLKSREYISDMIGKDYVVKPTRSTYNKLTCGITTLPPYHFLYFDLDSEETEIGVLKLGAGGIKTVKNPNVKPQEETSDD